MEKRHADLSPGQLQDMFATKAESDPGYAVAWALCRLADAQRASAAALDRLGFNAVRADAPGTTEFIGMELKRIADALEQQAARAADDE